jgi:hypothetical protein
MLGLTLIQAEFLSFMMDTGLRLVQHQLDLQVLQVQPVQPVLVVQPELLVHQAQMELQAQLELQAQQALPAMVRVEVWLIHGG